MNKTKITIEATVSANVKKVWDYFTKPEHITKWNFAIDSWHCPSAENDNPLEMQRTDLQAILNNFKKYVESN